MTDEIWKPVVHPVHCKNYEVSTFGRIRRSTNGVGKAHQARAGHILSLQSHGKSGHLHVAFREPGRKQPKTFLVHRMVLEAFVGPCPEGMECCHNDSDPANNRIDNLRWDTRLANTLDRADHKMPPTVGELNSQAVLSLEDVRAIRRAPLYRGARTKLAGRYGVSVSTISCILLGKLWRQPEAQA